ncbi:hypothetical protein SAMN00120144_0713 [Hymenobacter roseosalivarius DSM 11622]|uniref:Heavy metal binding domain-containing protein n=1 Tax=Hymenobacter roseosalivarius DSM 11622 TaxID=645990 RepID=A0A1W1UR58_9BACT|nr:efflux RND transporter periplasmic adaptor subunit [Hymenobacter roseosalivarius]SMB83499.1 hypothetical protein SAMN00120144_0713 [Hymenobacter roseosalivarius DSM 11622]
MNNLRSTWPGNGCSCCCSGWGACQKTKPAAPAGAARQEPVFYTCPMHPQVHEASPGSCPICHMDLAKMPPKAARTGADEPAGAADLILTAQQIELGNIKVRTIGASPVGAPPQDVLTGTVTANAEQTASVSRRVAGRVEQLYVRQTRQVLRRGAPLFAVFSEQLQALQQEYLVALRQGRESGGAYQQFAEATAQKLRLLGLTTRQLRQLAARGRPDPLVTYYKPPDRHRADPGRGAGPVRGRRQPAAYPHRSGHRVGGSPAVSRRGKPTDVGPDGRGAGGRPGGHHPGPGGISEPGAARHQPSHAGPRAGG